MKRKTILVIAVATLVLLAGCTGSTGPAETNEEDSAVCGDGICSNSESSATCPEDCGEEQETQEGPPMPPS